MQRSSRSPQRRPERPAPVDLTVTIESTDDGFAVADDGAGIPEDAQDNIFDYCYTTHEAGTGLGLSIVQTIADSHGWSVRHDPNHTGARFVFEGVELADALEPARMV